MKNYRCERVADLLTREIAQILKNKVSDPRLQLVTITSCRVTRDIRLARIYYTMIDPEQNADSIREGLDSASGFIRRELGNHIELRYVPELRFEYDQSLDNGNRIWEQLESLDHSASESE